MKSPAGFSLYPPSFPGIAFGTLLALGMITAQVAPAQTFSVLHSFTGNSDGLAPGGAGVTIDRAGNLYGGTEFGGLGGCYLGFSCGVLYKLSHRQTGWVFSTLYEFHDADGATPDAPLVVGPDGALYGTTIYGGIDDQGVVYRLQPPLTACKTSLCFWTESVLHAFSGGNDEARPAWGALTFDAAGNVYGTTTGNESGNGNVYELVHGNGQWTFNLLYTFTGEQDGANPLSGVIFDATGNLYGTAATRGEFNGGTAYELSPTDGSWTFTPLHQFVPGSDGNQSLGNLVFDPFGNLLGTNRFGGPGGAGSVFELTPQNNGWLLTTLRDFTGEVGPEGSVTMDAAGNLYGTSTDGGQFNAGVVFKLTPIRGGYLYSVLHEFTGYADGAAPAGQIVLDADGNLYGIAEAGGITGGNCSSDGCGVVWEITP